jgi:hypothetical protein
VAHPHRLLHSTAKDEYHFSLFETQPYLAILVINLVLPNSHHYRQIIINNPMLISSSHMACGVVETTLAFILYCYG